MLYKWVYNTNLIYEINEWFLSFCHILLDNALNWDKSMLVNQ